MTTSRPYMAASMYKGGHWDRIERGTLAARGGGVDPAWGPRRAVLLARRMDLTSCYWTLLVSGFDFPHISSVAAPLQLQSTCKSPALSSFRWHPLSPPARPARGRPAIGLSLHQVPLENVKERNYHEGLSLRGVYSEEIKSTE